jgi:nucleoside-diphosphate-sugar epimerase
LQALCLREHSERVPTNVPGQNRGLPPLLTAWTDDPVSAYIRQKLQLEDELITNAAAHQAEHTILRPSFIFGPYNYAPRESWFIQRIVTGKPIPVPVDATAEYSMVYVTDVARALMLAAIEPGAANTIFNLAAPEHITYQTLLSELERCNGAPFAQTPVSVAQVLDENIPLPFPLNDNDLTSAKLFTDAFIFHWTPFSEAMDKTFAAFKSVFSAS